MHTDVFYKKYLKSKVMLLAGILLAFFVLTTYFFYHAGTYLVSNQPPVRADVIVVLMGSKGDRTFEAYELCKAGFADKIFFVEDHEIGRKLLKEQGINLPNDADITKETLTKLGVPDSLITIIPGDTQSTKEEALLLFTYLQDRPLIDTLLLVTSASHSRRAAFTFRKILSGLTHPVIIISCPSRYSEFEAKRWWTDRSSAKQVAYEYSRLVYFWLWDRF